jgi:hypothetical protein
VQIVVMVLDIPGYSADPLLRNDLNYVGPTGSENLLQLKAWLPFANNQAAAMSSYWSVRTLDQSELAGANKCFSDSQNITGIVSTNSTEYASGPPAYRASDGSLNYEVVSPHLTNENATFLGTYDLLIRKDVAKCIYGFTNAPIKASISVIGSDGNTEVATTSLSESNGWLHLSANNFEFSAPVISAKLMQDPPATTDVEPAAPVAQVNQIVTQTNAQKAHRQIQITCVKG